MNALEKRILEIRDAAEARAAEAEAKAEKYSALAESLQVEADKYREVLSDIVYGRYDNAHDITAAREHAAKALQ